MSCWYDREASCWRGTLGTHKDMGCGQTRSWCGNEEDIIWAYAKKQPVFAIFNPILQLKDWAPKPN